MTKHSHFPERPDVIIDVVDVTNLERNLYLTVLLHELEIPIVAALNILDEAEKKGYPCRCTSPVRIVYPCFQARNGKP